MGGTAPIYYANNIFKFVSKEKKDVEKDGFVGFTVDITFCKSRTAAAGQVSTMIYDQNIGFDRARTLYNYLDEFGMIGGTRNNAKFVKGYEDIKFNKLKFTEEFYNRPEVRDAVMDVALPMMRDRMFRITNDDLNSVEMGISEKGLDQILDV